MNEHPRWLHVIGVMGGLGPHAHLEFESLLLEATEKFLGRPAQDQDYPPWILSSMPTTPDRSGALLRGTESPVEAMVRSANRLKDAGFAVIPCNTAHAFLDDVRPRVSIPILDMIRVTAERSVEGVGRTGTIGLLAASGTLASGLYPARIHEIAQDVTVVSPLELENGDELQERLVMKPIFGPLVDGKRAGGGIKSGAFRDSKRRDELAEPLREATRKLAAAGCEIVLTACTEIPLVLGRDRVDGIPLLDPMAVAAEASVDTALGRRPLPD